MNNSWTQTPPKKSGYYWFAMQYEEQPVCLYFEVENDIAETYGYFINDPLTCDGSEGYYFPAYPVEVPLVGIVKL